MSMFREFRSPGQIDIVRAYDNGKLYWYEPHPERCDRTKFAVSVCPGSIWCVCKRCRDYYGDVREAPRASRKAIRSAR